jgi:hypothetical protein
VRFCRTKSTDWVPITRLNNAAKNARFRWTKTQTTPPPFSHLQHVRSIGNVVGTLLPALPFGLTASWQGRVQQPGRRRTLKSRCTHLVSSMSTRWHYVSLGTIATCSVWPRQSSVYSCARGYIHFNCRKRHVALPVLIRESRRFEKCAEHPIGGAVFVRLAHDAKLIQTIKAPFLFR